MLIIEFKHLMEGTVTSFMSEAADPERWNDLSKVTKLVSGRSGTQTHTSRGQNWSLNH